MFLQVLQPLFEKFSLPGKIGKAVDFSVEMWYAISIILINGGFIHVFTELLSCPEISSGK